MKGFVAVHAGAGYHAENLRPQYKNACKKACKAAIALLDKKCSSVEAVAAAVAELENSPITNAGIGSNLTLHGTVECDAGIMDGKSLNFGSVGALANIKNPVQVAHKILLEQNKGLLSFGRIPPSTLVGEGALEWAIENGFTQIDQRELTTKTSRGIYLKNISLLKDSQPVTKSFYMNSSEQTSFDESTLLDTVGAICIDTFGNVSSAVSSGGLLLKHSGRIGQAAMYGSGCWAQNSDSPDKPNVACSITGVGEYLIKTLFAKQCYTMFYENSSSVFALHNIFTKYFLKSPYLKNISSKLAGTLALKHYPQDNFSEVSWAHTTKTMILGYMSGNDTKPTCIVSVQPSEAVCGESIIGCEKRIKL